MGYHADLASVRNLYSYGSDRSWGGSDSDSEYSSAVRAVLPAWVEGLWVYVPGIRKDVALVSRAA